MASWKGQTCLLLDIVLQWPIFFFCFVLFCLFILRERERECVHMSVGRGRVSGRENPKQAPCRQHKPGAVLNLLNHETMIWAEIKSQMPSRHPNNDWAIQSLDEWAIQVPQQWPIYFLNLFSFFKMFIYFWERERERQREWERAGREREGDRESEAGSSLWADSTEPNANSRTMRSWPEPKSDG